MNPQPGDVWLADLGLAAKSRPVIIVSRSVPDSPRALGIYILITTQNRQTKYEIPLLKLPFIREISSANFQGLASIPTVRLERKLGKVPDTLMNDVRQAIRFAPDL